MLGLVRTGQRQELRRGVEAGLLAVRGVSLQEGEAAILDANVDVGFPGITAVVAPEWAGTLLLCTVQGLVRPASGTVLVQGRDVGGMSAPEVERVGVTRVRRSVIVAAGEMVVEHLVMAAGGLAGLPSPRLGWSQRLRGDARHRYEHANAVLDRLGLGSLGGKCGAELDGAEQAGVAVARALMRSRRLLLADVPDRRTPETEMLVATLCAASEDVAALVVTPSRVLAQTLDASPVVLEDIIRVVR